MLCEDQSFCDLNSMHCIVVLWYYCKKNLAKTVLPIFSTVRHSNSVFLLYYTTLYYNGKRMCTMSRTYAAQLRLARLPLGCGCSRQRWQWKAFFLALEYPSFSVLLPTWIWLPEKFANIFATKIVCLFVQGRHSWICLSSWIHIGPDQHWLSNIQASVCCYPHRSDFTKELPIFLQ